MKKASAISKRGKRASTTELRTDMDLYFEASNDLWTSDNPDGKFPLNMAENNLSWNLLSDQIDKILKGKPLPKWVSNYTGLGGEENYLDAIAKFMSKHICHAKIAPDHLATSAGSTAVIELASWVLCNKNDVALIPAPSYPVYTQDIGNKSAVERHDLITHHKISKIKDGPALRIKHLDKARKHAKNEGKRIGMLLLTNPDNPTGNIYSRKLLLKISKWCIKHKIHLVVNEIYALSLISRNANIDKEKKNGASFGKIMVEMKSDYLHLLYGLSKDFGISGFRVGIFHSLNEQVLAAYRNLNAPHMVSNVTQHLVTEILSNDAFITKYIAANQKHLTETFNIVAKKLDKLNIEYVNAKGSLFVWLDLSIYLKKQSKKAEHKFWLKLYRETGILLTPGDGFGNTKRGQFRLVHSFLPPAALSVAMDRFSDFIGSSN